MARPDSRRKADKSEPSTAQYVVGVDLGGTNLALGAMTADGTNQYAMHTVPTRAELGADGVVARIVEGVERVIAETRAATGAPQRSIWTGVPRCVASAAGPRR